jgi:hypothetical protein
MPPSRNGSGRRTSSSAAHEGRFGGEGGGSKTGYNAGTIKTGAAKYWAGWTGLLVLRSKRPLTGAASLVGARTPTDMLDRGVNVGASGLSFEL